MCDNAVLLLLLLLMSLFIATVQATSNNEKTNDRKVFALICIATNAMWINVEKKNDSQLLAALYRDIYNLSAKSILHVHFAAIKVIAVLYEFECSHEKKGTRTNFFATMKWVRCCFFSTWKKFRFSLWSWLFCDLLSWTIDRNNWDHNYIEILCINWVQFQLLWLQKKVHVERMKKRLQR